MSKFVDIRKVKWHANGGDNKHVCIKMSYFKPKHQRADGKCLKVEALINGKWRIVAGIINHGMLHLKGVGKKWKRSEDDTMTVAVAEFVDCDHFHIDVETAEFVELNEREDAT